MSGSNKTVLKKSYQGFPVNRSPLLSLSKSLSKKRTFLPSGTLFSSLGPGGAPSLPFWFFFGFFLPFALSNLAGGLSEGV